VHGRSPWQAALLLLLASRAQNEPWTTTARSIADELTFYAGGRPISPPYEGLTELLAEWEAAGVIERTKAKGTMTVRLVLSYGSAPAAPREPKLLWTPEAGWQNLADAKVARWQDAYPGVDVQQQLKAMDAWLRANPDRRKKNWERFVVNWLSRPRDRDAPRIQPRRDKGVPALPDRRQPQAHEGNGGLWVVCTAGPKAGYVDHVAYSPAAALPDADTRAAHAVNLRQQLVQAYGGEWEIVGTPAEPWTYAQAMAYARQFRACPTIPSVPSHLSHLFGGQSSASTAASQRPASSGRQGSPLDSPE